MPPENDYNSLWNLVPERFRQLVAASPESIALAKAKARSAKAGEKLLKLKAKPTSDAVAKEIKAQEDFITRSSAREDLLKKKMGWQGRVKETLKTGWRRYPGMSSAGAVGAATLLAPLVVGPVKQFLEDTGVTHKAEDELYARLQGQRKQNEFASALAHQQRQADLLRKQNAATLMQTNPFLAMQLLAGRELPLGATVIGGQPRQDILERAASILPPSSPPQPGGGFPFGG